MFHWPTWVMCLSLNQSLWRMKWNTLIVLAWVTHNPWYFRWAERVYELSGLNMWPQLLKSTRRIACALGYTLSMLNHSVMSDSLQPHGRYPTRLLCSWDFPGKNIGLPFPPPGDLPVPGTECQSPALQADSLLSKLPEKSHMSTTLGSPTKLENLELVNRES